jgi:nucleotide-binding universal stress UspA family protein
LRPGENLNNTSIHYWDSLSSKTRISKILVPLDDSESATNAADYALLITKGLNAELIAIHVVRSEDALVATNLLIEDLDTVTTGDSILQKVKEDAQKWFNEIKQKSNANGIRLRTGLVISPTDIEDAIVNYAERENVDLIVIGGGKSGLKQRLLGSTTSHVATQTNRPILIVK